MTKTIFSAVILLLLASSCSTQRAIVSQNKKERERDYQYTTQFQPFFVYGIGQTNEVNLEEICGSSDKVHTFLVKDTFLDLVLRSITVGIYTPRAARVYCVVNSGK